MTEFVVGQRWVADSEPELGLGTVAAVEGRTVTILFEQAECERRYASSQAPLTRIQFSAGDEIQLRDGSKATVSAVHEQSGLLIYNTGSDQLVLETMISSEIRLNQPMMRLMTGQVNEPKWFNFRRRLDRAIANAWRSRLGGLLGVRANLIPHQLYVAWTACEREQVRVLLADEVGLGKTIEAGMILTRLIKLERVERALVVVPDALQVQWLVELVRRFSLRPELYRGEEHEFDFGQIHIVPHSALATDAQRIQDAGFDISIVDEAHHVQLGTEAFDCMGQLAELCEHFVLLTATPEQLGLESHFHRLRLLDPTKFTSLEQLVAQEEHYKQLNQKIRALPESRSELIKEYQLDAKMADDHLVDELLDCHGIGRVMFRNARKSISGFPVRLAEPHSVADDTWEAKYEWLAQWLKNIGNEKVLVIMHSLENVRDCEQYLWQKHGIDAALFHEQQTLIDRDSAAAYFADPTGSQLLLCSEIGSEGRNFQFSCHLICLDLPEHPDLLEQRIGRLDRIGQKRDVHIHIPFAPASFTAMRFFWFHKVLQCIEQQNPAASAIHDQYWLRLGHADHSALAEGADDTPLLQEARCTLADLQADIQAGRDALLEMNSCRQPSANQLVERIKDFESHTPHALVEIASDLLQFHFEETQAGAFSLIPADKMLIPALPGIPPEGTEVTFSRELANAREDLLFITWDSPFIQGLWEILHHSELGSASVAALPHPKLPPGRCLLEACFDVIIQSPYAVQCLPFLDEHSIRAVVLGGGDADLAAALNEELLEQLLIPVKRNIARQLILAQKDDIPLWHQKIDGFATSKKDTIIKAALEKAKQFFENEIGRLRKLSARNPAVTLDEITALETKRDNLLAALQNNAHLQLSAIRLIIVTD